MSWLSTTRSFLTDVKSELKRTTFPSKKEVRGTTTVVILTVFLFGIYLWIVDTFLYKAVEWIFGLVG